MNPEAPVRLAVLADLHGTVKSDGELRALFAELGSVADVVAICGDLTDHGLVEEAEVLANALGSIRIPVVAVFGNHDYESERPDEIRAILGAAGVALLDGEAFEAHGLGFAGVKGFAGGFGRHALGPWGEPGIKRFVQEAVEEELKLERGLARLRMPARFAILHYAPIVDTVRGEPEPIFPYLGSGRLEEPLNRYRVTAAFHGHAHRGAPEGRTETGIPVYNVSMPLLRRTNPDEPPYRLFLVSRQEGTLQPVPASSDAIR